MTANQAKVGMETAKEVQNDPTLKSKQDKERRLKEKTANNVSEREVTDYPTYQILQWCLKMSSIIGQEVPEGETGPAQKPEQGQGKSQEEA